MRPSGARGVQESGDAEDMCDRRSKGSMAVPGAPSAEVERSLSH